MASMFDDLEAVLSSAVRGMFCEQAVLRPRLRLPYTAGMRDPGRAPHTTKGVFSDGPGLSPISGAGGSFGGDRMLNASVAEFWIGPADAGLVPFEIEPGDQVHISQRPGQPVYTISAIQRTATGEINLVMFDTPNL